MAGDDKHNHRAASSSQSGSSAQPESSHTIGTNSNAGNASDPESQSSSGIMGGGQAVRSASDQASFQNTGSQAPSSGADSESGGSPLW